MYSVAVFHAKAEKFGFGVAEAQFPRDYVLAAVVDVEGTHVGESEALATAFRLTNTIDFSWFLNRHVIPTGQSLRSTSVGDVMVTRKEKFRVAMAGFEAF